MALRLLLGVISIILCNSVGANAGLDTLDIAGKRTAHLTRYYQYLEDCQEFSASTVEKKLIGGEFLKPSPDKAFNMGLSRCVYWLAIALKNDSPDVQSMLWSFYNNGLLLHLYEIENGIPTLIDSNSMHKPLAERSFPVRAVAFEVKFKAHETKVLLVKIERTIANAVYSPIDISMTKDSLLYEIKFSYLLGKYIGYFLLALVINVLLGFALKNKLHLFHGCYILMIVGLTLNDFHFDALEFHGNFFSYWSYINELFFVSMALFFFIKVFMIFTDQKLHFPRSYKFLNIYNNLLLLIAGILFISSQILAYRSPANLFISEFAFYYTIVGFVFVISSLFQGVYYKKYYSILYLVSSALLVAGFVSLISNILQRDRLYFLPPGNIVNGLLAEITILTIVFVYKYKKENEDNARKALMSVKQKEELTHSLVMVQEAERKRIAQDLHDDVGNNLTGLRLFVQNYYSKASPRNKAEDEFQELLISELTKVNCDLRNISHNLLPQDLELGGLISGIKTQLELAERNNSNIKFEFVYDGNFEELNSEIEVNIYRVFTELLQNIVKHSGAAKATFECLVFNNTLQVIAEDNGQGFNPEVSGSGIGITNIKSRVSYLRGIYRIDSSSLGTTTIIEIPII